MGQTLVNDRPHCSGKAQASRNQRGNAGIAGGGELHHADMADPRGRCMVRSATKHWWDCSFVDIDRPGHPTQGDSPHVVLCLKRHPQLKIDLNASEGALNLVEARIDLAIRISAEPDPMPIGRVLAPCTSVLVASPAYLTEHGVPQAPADLARHRCLSYANFGKSVWKLSRGDQIAQISVGGHLSANEATALLRAALAGGGIALQPTYLANPHLADGSLHAVLPDWTLPDMAIYALYPSRKHLSPAVRALLDFLVERFASARW